MKPLNKNIKTTSNVLDLPEENEISNQEYEEYEELCNAYNEMNEQEYEELYDAYEEYANDFSNDIIDYFYEEMDNQKYEETTEQDFKDTQICSDVNKVK
jgi:hypothetical protein